MATFTDIRDSMAAKRPRCEYPLCNDRANGYSRRHKMHLCNGHRKQLLNQEQKRRGRAAHDVQGEPVSGDDNAL